MFSDDKPPERGKRESIDCYAETVARFHKERDDIAELAELIVDKQRMGARKIVKMRFVESLTLFKELGPDAPPPGEYE